MNDTAAGSKDELRRKALARRDALDPAERALSSRLIVERLAALLADRIVRSVAVTSPIRSEADVMPLIATAADSGLDTALPSVDGGELVFRKWRPSEPLIPGALGVLEPLRNAATITPDMIVLPLAAFDRAGNRLGYGRGHFDRALAALVAPGARPLVVGAGFAVQEVSAIPIEPHDIALDLVVTEKGLIEPSR